jgi:hypothetical protein
MADDATRLGVEVVVRLGHRHVRPGFMGWLGFKSAPTPPTLHLHVAQAWELMVPDDVYRRAAPLVNALATRTINRKHYKLLRALLVENALLTGQPEVTEHILGAIEKQWSRCPWRYLWP